MAAARRGPQREGGRIVVTEAVATHPSLDTLLDLGEVAFALSDALDLVGLSVVQHGKRVAHMADEVGAALGLTTVDRDDLFLAALLHDAGVSRSAVHRLLIDTFDWEESCKHCCDGAELLAAFPPFGRIARVVLRHHTHWDDPLMAAEDPTDALIANAIFLADRVDALCRRSLGRDLLLARGEIRFVIGDLAGTYFAPDVVEAFRERSEPEAFWLMLESHHLERHLLERSHQLAPHLVTFHDLEGLALVFARIVDRKSSFTAEHSTGVARLARKLGELSGLPESDGERLYLAGLLHDLGKLRIPDEILDKQGPLDRAERATMEHHTFETWQILRRIGPLRGIAGWAAYHHEALDGHGYPFHRHGDEIPWAARLVAVADVFQALAQQRPYRGALPPREIVLELRKMVRSGKLDRDAVELVGKNLAVCHHAAVAGAE